MLTLHNVHAFYGKSHVLHGVNFEVRPGEIVALLGRNGSGRSTTVKTIMGFVILGAGATLVINSLGDFAVIFQHAFGIKGVVPNNEALSPLPRHRLAKRWR